MPAWILIVLILIGSLVVLKLLLAFSIISVLPVTRGAMFHPSARIRVKTFLDHVPMTGEDLLVDIGCGDGRVLREARRRYGVRALGIEVNPLIYLLARIRNIGIEGVRVQMKNFWKMNLGNADVVFCYLFPDVMTSLAEKLAEELRPGTRVISCNFPLPGWIHTAVVYPESSLNGDPIYFYRSPDPSIKAVSRPFDVNHS
jgi:SAM-dependent methyltransferase